MSKYYIFCILCVVALASGALGVRIGGKLGFGQAKDFYSRRTMQIIDKVVLLTNPLIKAQSTHDFESMKACWNQANEMDDGDLPTAILNNLGRLEQKMAPAADSSLPQEKRD